MFAPFPRKPFVAFTRGKASVVVVASAAVVAKRVAGYFTRSPSPLRQTFTHRQSPGQSNRVANSVAGSPTLVQAPLDAAIAARPTIRASASQCVVATVAVVASAVAGTIVFAPSNAAPNAREICVASAEPLVAHAIPIALLWARHQPARLALPANVAQTTVGGAGAVVGTLLRAEDRFCAAVTSPTEVARACIRRVVADTSCVAVARAGAHFRLAHGPRVTVFAVARRLATGGGGGGFQQSSRNLGMFGTRQYRPLRFAWYTWYTWYTWYIAIEAIADVVVGL